MSLLRKARFISSLSMVTLAAAGVCRLQVVSAQTLAPAPPVSALATDVALAVSPANPAVRTGASLQFAATFSGTTSGLITWTATGGTISQTGLFIAGSTPGSYLVAASLSDGTASVSTPVVVAQNAPVTVQPGDDIAAAVNAAPGGTAFLLKSGIYRLQSIVPKTGDAFLGEPGTVLSGGRVLTSFAREGSYWVVAGQTQEGPTIGLDPNSPAQCQSGFPRCMRPEDLFFDDRPLLHVDRLSNVAAGRWFFDYAADKIYFADDPTGRKVETSVTTQAVRATAGVNNVIIRGLTVEKYANPAQTGAVSGVDAARWIVEANEIRLNHGTGVTLTGGPNHRIARNNIHDNGEMGINTYNTDGMMVDANEIAYNNYAGYVWWWEGGGTKFSWSRTLTVRNNYSHHNHGIGLWTDTDNLNVVYENNVASDNEGHGIFHEIGYDAVIRNNVTERNGYHGIIADASPNVQVYGNVVRFNVQPQQIMGRQGTPVTRVGRYGLLTLQNFYVHDNTIVGGGTGVWPTNEASGDTSFYTSRNNRFVHNTYDLKNASTAPFYWMLASRNETAWRGYGEDVTGVFTR